MTETKTPRKWELSDYNGISFLGNGPALATNENVQVVELNALTECQAKMCNVVRDHSNIVDENCRLHLKIADLEAKLKVSEIELSDYRTKAWDALENQKKTITAANELMKETANFLRYQSMISDIGYTFDHAQLKEIIAKLKDGK